MEKKPKGGILEALYAKEKLASSGPTKLLLVKPADYEVSPHISSIAQVFPQFALNSLSGRQLDLESITLLAQHAPPILYKEPGNAKNAPFQIIGNVRIALLARQCPQNPIACLLYEGEDPARFAVVDYVLKPILFGVGTDALKMLRDESDKWLDANHGPAKMLSEIFKEFLGIEDRKSLAEFLGLDSRPSSKTIKGAKDKSSDKAAEKGISDAND